MANFPPHLPPSSSYRRNYSSHVFQACQEYLPLAGKSDRGKQQSHREV